MVLSSLAAIVNEAELRSLAIQSMLLFIVKAVSTYRSMISQVVEFLL